MSIKVIYKNNNTNHININQIYRYIVECPKCSHVLSFERKDIVIHIYLTTDPHLDEPGVIECPICGRLIAVNHVKKKLLSRKCVREFLYGVKSMTYDEYYKFLREHDE